MIKKVLALVLASLMIVSVVGCAQKTDVKDTVTNPTESETVNISKEDEKTVTDALNEFLASNYENYEIVKITKFSTDGEYEGKPLQYETIFTVKVDGKECNFLTKMVQDAPVAVFTDLHHSSIVDEFAQFLDKNDLMKSAIRKEYEITTFEGSTLLPAEIKTLESLFEVAVYEKFNISASYVYENRDKFNPESINIASATEAFSNYKITLYNTKNAGALMLDDTGSTDTALYNKNILDRIEYSMNVVDTNKKDEVVPATTTEVTTQEPNYEQSVSIVFNHRQFHNKGDMTFSYDNRFYDISIEKIDAPDIPSEWGRNTEDNLYYYEAFGESYTIRVKDKTPCTADNFVKTASYATYNYKTESGKTHYVTAYYDGLTVIFPLEEYKGSIPHYVGVGLPIEITNKDYFVIDLSALQQKEFELSFYKKMPNINTQS